MGGFIYLAILFGFMMAGWCCGYQARRDEEVREKARAFEKLRDERALAAVHKHFATARD